MKKRYDRSAICKRAHELKRNRPWSEAMRLAWAEAKSGGVVALAPQRLPLEAIVVDTWSLARRIANGSIRAGIRVKIDLGVEIIPEGSDAIRRGASLERFATVAYSKQKNQARIEHR